MRVNSIFEQSKIMNQTFKGLFQRAFMSVFMLMNLIIIDKPGEV
jgi:hypothetical protein